MANVIFGRDHANTTAPTVTMTTTVDDGANNLDVLLGDLLKIINGLTADTAPLIADSVVTYDDSAAAPRKVALDNLLKVINGLTEDTAPVIADFLTTYDASASAAKKVGFSNLLKIINELSADATPDRAADYIVTYDASASAVKKVLLNLIPPQAWTSFTPSWTNLTLGAGTNVGAYVQIGKTIHWRISFTFAADSSVGGALQVGFPVNTHAAYITDQKVGDLSMRDVSAFTSFTGIAAWSTSSTILLRVNDVGSSTYGQLLSTSSLIPFTWATGDLIAMSGTYEAA